MIQSKSCSLFVCALIVGLTFCLPAVAQDATTGQIVGNVTDQTAAIIPGAKVTVKNSGTGQTINVTANELGHFVAPLLPPGSYTVSVNAEGFSALSKGPVTVPAGTSTTVNLELLVGGVSEVVSVEAG